MSCEDMRTCALAARSRSFIGARTAIAEARSQGKRPDLRGCGWRGAWAGTPRGEGEGVTRKSGRTSSDPGALGLVAQESHGSGRASKGSGGGGVRIVPLNAWARLFVGLGDPRCYGGGVSRVQVVVGRCDVVRLHPTAEQEELLRVVGDQCARLINMENYRRGSSSSLAGA
jgi:hypothetical protein